VNKARDILITIGFVVMILCIGPFDIFFHGFYCETKEYDQIYEEDLQSLPLLEQNFEQVFVPQKRHFAGVSMYLAGSETETAGELLLRIYDEKGTCMDQALVHLESVQLDEWHPVYMGKRLKAGETYTLQICTQNRQEPLHLKLVDADYLPEETIKGNLLVGYAYGESTFDFQEKTLIILFLVAVWLFLFRKQVRLPFIQGIGGTEIARFLFLTILLTWNYSFNSMNHGNEAFVDFHARGETLVMGCVYAEHGGVVLHEYGLGRYTDIKGTLSNYTTDFLTDENWEHGYSRTEPMIAVANHPFTKRTCVVGNTIRFANGDAFVIEQITEKKKYLYLALSAEQALLEGKYGSLSEVQFLDQEGKVLKGGMLEDYESQYGLQGKVFRTLARYMEFEKVLTNLRFLCSLGTAVIFTLLVLALAYKYNTVLAFSFYLVFWLSPWVVNFAHNLYWVEFTWFLPMLIGIICSIKLEDKRYRLSCYGAVMIAVLGKSLCGYEYITNVMLGGITFFVLDFVNAVREKDKERGKLIFCTTFWFGLFSLLGFLLAICMHGKLRGNGDILAGIQSILEQDVLRRVGGGEMGNFEPVYWDSLNTSVWETLGRYFHFSTEVLAGIPGNVFPLLCSTPVGIFLYRYKKGTINWKDVWMYLTFFTVCVSWFVLAKPHSYIHLHLNYVLWYFGYVQICIYIIVKQVLGKEFYAL
jgi:hypothetical protein